MDRLTRIDYVQGAATASEQLLERIDYQYDAKGQRTAKNTLNANGTGQGETPMEASYDSSNRLLSITLKPGADASTHTTWNLSYDANGNLTNKVNAANSAEVTTYTWDSDNRLTGLSKTEGATTVTASFQYDLFGRRISSSIQQGTASAQNPPQTVQFLYEGQQALGEIRSGNLSHRLITGLSLDETIARIAIAGSGAADIPASRQYLTDALNSVIAQANAQGGGIANSYGYSAYGQSSTVGPETTGNTAQYTSRENDAQGATGLYFYRARYYDPVLKRFISEDPIGLAGGMNKFAYVEGNPISKTDPSGLQSISNYMCHNAGLPAWCPPPEPPPPDCPDDGCDQSWNSCVDKCVNVLNPWFAGLLASGVAFANAPPAAGAAGVAIGSTAQSAAALWAAWGLGTSLGCVAVCTADKCAY